VRVERVIVWGAGGHGRVVADLVRAAGHEVVAFADRRDAATVGGKLGSIALLREDELLAAAARGALPRSATAVVVAIGDNRARQLALAGLGALVSPAFVHPTAAVSPRAKLGPGTVVMAQAAVNADAVIGAGVIINSGAIVEHDCQVGDAVHLSPGATLTGDVTVAERAWVGAGAVVLPGISVGRDAVVGAGAVVVRNVDTSQTVMGVPARADGRTT
jgi:sugar O-acyltransferase (sialic acid O-acetyltransferase NeuD family)